jgi:serpin B
VESVADLDKRMQGLSEKNIWGLPSARLQDVRLTLPKFKLTEEFQLQEVLGRMGMPAAFQPGTADFSGMDGKKDLYLSKVLHKAYVEVNEEGTEAAAGTGVVVAPAAVRVPYTFRADHPFLFLIRDNRTGSDLFVGRVVNPKSE